MLRPFKTSPAAPLGSDLRALGVGPIKGFQPNSLTGVGKRAYGAAVGSSGVIVPGFGYGPAWKDEQASMEKQVGGVAPVLSPVHHIVYDLCIIAGKLMINHTPKTNHGITANPKVAIFGACEA